MIEEQERRFWVPRVPSNSDPWFCFFLCLPMPSPLPLCLHIRSSIHYLLGLGKSSKGVIAIEHFCHHVQPRSHVISASTAKPSLSLCSQAMTPSKSTNKHIAFHHGVTTAYGSRWSDRAGGAMLMEGCLRIRSVTSPDGFEALRPLTWKILARSS